jgi:signal peptidase II
MTLADQVLKAWVRHAMPIGGSLDGLPWPGVFELKLTYNEGVAFGAFQGFGRFLAPVAVAIFLGSSWYAFKHPRESVLIHVATGLLAAGAIGNLWDRVFEGRVTDMLWFRPINFPVFNIADACITVATILLIVTWWSDALKAKQPPQPAPVEVRIPQTDPE